MSISDTYLPHSDSPITARPTLLSPIGEKPHYSDKSPDVLWLQWREVLIPCLFLTGWNVPWCRHSSNTFSLLCASPPHFQWLPPAICLWSPLKFVHLEWCIWVPVFRDTDSYSIVWRIVVCAICPSCLLTLILLFSLQCLHCWYKSGNPLLLTLFYSIGLLLWLLMPVSFSFMVAWATCISVACQPDSVAGSDKWPLQLAGCLSNLCNAALWLSLAHQMALVIVACVSSVSVSWYILCVSISWNPQYCSPSNAWLP